MRRWYTGLRFRTSRTDGAGPRRVLLNEVKGNTMSTTTNIPLSFLPDLVSATAKLDFDEIATVGFTPGYYAPERDHNYKPIPDVGRIRAKVDRVLSEGPEAQSSDGVSECGV